MIRLTLPYPPSANRLWRAVGGRNIESAEYRKWKASCRWLTVSDGRGPIFKAHYTATITADRPDKRRRDIGNLEKPVSDMLVTLGIVRDDSDAQRITLQWSDKPPAKPAFVHIEVEAV